ncbi:MAG TPA: hypothetical protein VHJ20_24945 [Polyangia bacterium]|nr:hypothetical protein [Polyangia bacterium]
MALSSTLGCGSATSLVGGDASTNPDTSQTSALCAISSTPATPFDVSFHFRADGAKPVYVHKGCIGVDYGVSSCASGFTAQLGPVYQCGKCECSAPLSMCERPTCGACYPDEGAAVAPGTAIDSEWSAVGIEFGENASGQCTTTTVLPGAKYRVSIRVFDNAADAEKNAGGWIATSDFTLPAAGGVVDVPLGAAHPESCEPAAGVTAPACTGAEPRDHACSVAAPFSFRWDGGLAQNTESFSVAAPAKLTATVTEGGANDVVKACDVAIPQCSADARVVTAGDLSRALTAPSVAAAFAKPMKVYGADTRPVDGTILIVERADGTAIGLGNPCFSGVGTCNDPTTDMLTLRDLLQRLGATVTKTACPDLPL